MPKANYPDYASARMLLAYVWSGLPDNAQSVMTAGESQDYANYNRWGIGPLGSARSWLAMARVSQISWPAWRILNNV